MFERTTIDVIKGSKQAGWNYTVCTENWNYNHIPTDSLVDGNLTITAKQINFLDAQAYQKIAQKSKSSYLGAGISVGAPVVSAAVQALDALKSVRNAKDKEGLINAGVNGVNSYLGGDLSQIAGLSTALLIL